MGLLKGVFLLGLFSLCLIGMALGIQDLYLTSQIHCTLGFWAVVIFPFTFPTLIVPMIALLSLKWGIQSLTKLISQNEGLK